MKKFFELSVHQLVDFVLRSGSLDDRHFNNKTMVEGTLIHQYYQAKQNDNYESEVYLEGIFKINDYAFKLKGRCDGVIKKDKEVIIDEIKSYNGIFEDFFKENEKWHLGQAECYAYMYLKKYNLSNIRIYLTYISQIDRKEKIIEYSYDEKTLKDKIESYFLVYLDFNKIISSLNDERDEFIEKMTFPFFSFRKGQEELVEFSKNTLLNNEINFVEAPTGTGKTLATLYGAIKEFNKAKLDKIFYLTPKNSGFDLALQAINLINKDDGKIKAITILSKEKMCLSSERRCNPDSCIFARNYFDKVKDLLKEVLLTKKVITEKDLKQIAFDNDICPFEFSLDLSLYVDVIICDYNYVFHPIAYLKRYFDNFDSTFNIFLLVDEAHNLIKRGRDMHSQSLSYSSFKKVYEELSDIKNIDLKRDLEELNDSFELFNKLEYNEEGEFKDYIVFDCLDDNFIKNISDLSNAYNDYIANHPLFKTEVSDEFFLEAYKFLFIYKLISNKHKIYIYKNENDYVINLFCLDPSEYLIDTFNKVTGALLFSATLTPNEYYKKMILKDNDTKFLKLKSPFDSKKLKLMINKNISLLYKDRKNTLIDVFNLVRAFINEKVGNYLLFVPSFDYLSLIKDKLKTLKDIKIVSQKKNMNVQEKTEFLNNFKTNPNKTHLGIAVLGGSFNEGIDLVNDRLIGVIIVGVGFPSTDFNNHLLKNYYDEIGYNGFDYTYVNFGITHVFQALGRLIRTENDYGSCLLIDKRYGEKKYQNLLKSSEKEYVYVNNEQDIKNNLEEFYKSCYNF